MKSASILVWIFSLFLISCTKSENLQVKQPNTTPVLEMSSESVGLFDVTGEMLDFRLYENGLVEFDTLDNNRKNQQKTMYRTDELKVTKQTYISEKEVERIMNLLKSDEFLNLEKTYTAKRAGTDISLNNTIHFQYETKEKTIRILDHIEDLSNPDPENFPGFPPILSNLYEQINKIRSQALKK
jgi:hypothetical protein